MKRVLQAVLAALCLAACAWLYLRWTGQTAAPLAAFVYSGGDAPGGLADVRGRLEADGYRTCQAAESGDLAADIRQLAAQGAELIVLKLDHTVTERAVIRAAEDAGAVLLFTGARPADTLLACGGTIWYLGAYDEDAGQQLGQRTADAFRAGLAADADGDHCLDYLCAAGSATSERILLAAALDECELYGVYPQARPEDTAAVQAAEASTLAALWAGLAPAPEVIFCTGTANALQALEAAGQLGWLDGETPVRLAAVADTRTDAEALAASGSFCTVVYLDDSLWVDAVYTLCVNGLEHRYLSYGTDLRQTSGLNQFMLSYQAAQTALTTAPSSAG